jgi:hypothetical protein
MDINIQDLLIFFNSKASTSIAGFLNKVKTKKPNVTVIEV